MTPRQEARRRGLEFYAPDFTCKRGHTSERRVSSGSCVACEKHRHREYRRIDPAARLRKQAEYRKNNAEKIREYHWARQGFPTPTRPCPDACENCGRVQEGRALALDHCHETGKFRGWLCVKCNVGIGKLGDTLEAILRTAEYLRRAA